MYKRIETCSLPAWNFLGEDGRKFIDGTVDGADEKVKEARRRVSDALKKAKELADDNDLRALEAIIWMPLWVEKVSNEQR